MSAVHFPDTAAAVVTDGYGTSARLRLEQRPVRQPAAEEVLIRVEAASLNAADKHVQRGKPYLIRLMYGPRRHKNPIVGQDLAGTVVAVGEGCTRLKPGDRVFGQGASAIAEFATVKEKAMQIIPAELDFRTAAALPIAATTAWRALQVGEVTNGSRVLIHGASGGVGSMAVQIATSMGSSVVASCSAANADVMRSLGAGEVVDYRTTNPLSAGPYDAIIDCVGNLPPRAAVTSVRPGGVVVKVGFGGGPWIGPMVPFIIAPFVRIGAPGRLHVLTAESSLDALTAVAELVQQGALMPLVEQEYALADFLPAFQRLESGRTVGKSIIRIGDAQ